MEEDVVFVRNFRKSPRVTAPNGLLERMRDRNLILAPVNSDSSPIDNSE